MYMLCKNNSSDKEDTLLPLAACGGPEKSPQNGEKHATESPGNLRKRVGAEQEQKSSQRLTGSTESLDDLKARMRSEQEQRTRERIAKLTQK
jgi:hypothetical protein